MRKMVRGILTMALVAVMMSFGGNVYASGPDTKGIGGTGWKLDEEGVFTLLADVPYVEGQPYEWAQYAEQIKEVAVAEGVTEIPTGAFSGIYKNLKKVTMSSTVKKIQTSAFSYNANLTEVTLNDGLEYVGHSAFAGTGITSIRLPDGVTWGGDVFTYCKNLTGTLVIPANSKWEQGSNAQFYGIGATTVIIEQGITEITNQFLSGCENLQYVWAPASLTNFGQQDLDNGIWDSPVPACCIIGYRGTMAEKYADHWLAVGAEWTRGMMFHAIDGEEHTFGEWQIIQNATCTDKGIMKHTCTICNAERTQEIAPAGHQWDSGKVTREATENTEGIKTYTCTVCGATKEETIPKSVISGNVNTDQISGEAQKTSALHNTGVPKTGDSAAVLAWVFLTLVSAGVITGFYSRKRSSR